MTIEPEDVDGSNEHEHEPDDGDGDVSISYPDAPHSEEWSDGLRREVEDAKIMGWEIDEDFGNRVVMVQRDIGSIGIHIVIFIVTFWSVGVCNGIYAAYRYYNCAEKKVLRE